MPRFTLPIKILVALLLTSGVYLFPAVNPSDDQAQFIGNQPTTALAASPVTSGTFTSLFGACNGETVQIDGRFQQVVNSGPDSASGFHQTFHVIMNGSGTGLTTGNRYLLNEVVASNFNTTQNGSTLTSTFEERFTIQNGGTKFLGTAHGTFIVANGTVVRDTFVVTGNCT